MSIIIFFIFQFILMIVAFTMKSVEIAKDIKQRN